MILDQNRQFEPEQQLTVPFLCRDPIIKKSLKSYAEKFEENKAKKELEERRKFPLEQRLKQYIVGQEGAITTVASAIRRWVK